MSKIRPANAEARKVQQYAQSLGYFLTYTSGNHRMRFVHPVTKAVVIAASTPSRHGFTITYHELNKGLPADHPQRSARPKRS